MRDGRDSRLPAPVTLIERAPTAPCADASGRGRGRGDRRARRGAVAVIGAVSYRGIERDGDGAPRPHGRPYPDRRRRDRRDGRAARVARGCRPRQGLGIATDRPARVAGEVAHLGMRRRRRVPPPEVRPVWRPALGQCGGVWPSCRRRDRSAAMLATSATRTGFRTSGGPESRSAGHHGGRGRVAMDRRIDARCRYRREGRLRRARQPAGSDAGGSWTRRPERGSDEGVNMEVKLIIDMDTCMGYGECVAEDPEAVELDQDGCAGCSWPRSIPIAPRASAQPARPAPSRARPREANAGTTQPRQSLPRALPVAGALFAGHRGQPAGRRGRRARRLRRGGAQ